MTRRRTTRHGSAGGQRAGTPPLEPNRNHEPPAPLSEDDAIIQYLQAHGIDPRELQKRDKLDDHLQHQGTQIDILNKSLVEMVKEAARARRKVLYYNLMNMPEESLKFYKRFKKFVPVAEKLQESIHDLRGVAFVIPKFYESDPAV